MAIELQVRSLNATVVFNLELDYFHVVRSSTFPSVEIIRLCCRKKVSWRRPTANDAGVFRSRPLRGPFPPRAAVGRRAEERRIIRIADHLLSQESLCLHLTSIANSKPSGCER